MKTAVIGGGAAGFFLAINLKEMMPEMEVTIFERGNKVLSKVEISGGGRCNCTNSFVSVRDLSIVYPRGHRLLKRLFRTFSPDDAYRWFESHGMPLVVQDDECVFPASQDSHSIIRCFLRLSAALGIDIHTSSGVASLADVDGYDFVVVTTGGSPRPSGLNWLADVGHEIVMPVPSLFTFRIDDEPLHQLMGTVADETTASIPATSFRASGPLLLTHWGMSGPAILRLSSYAARALADSGYNMPLSVNWVSRNDDEIRAEILRLKAAGGQKLLSTLRPFNLSSRLWTYLLDKCLGQRARSPWSSLNAKETNRLVNILANDSYQISGRAAFKDEFVTCGGVSLASVHPATLESKCRPGLYFAGEVLDIDGVTGGFNFQAAWTTAYTVARSISATI